jgi:putative copper resistance protein D
VADGFHILGASAWLGGLTCLIIVGLPAATQAHDGRGPAVASMVNAFSPIALACAGLVVLTGATSAWLRLGGLEPLWTSAYGRVLLLKVGLMIGVAATGAYNWLRVKPALGTSESTVRLKKSATVELAVGVAVIAVTAFLVALPTPLDTP